MDSKERTNEKHPQKQGSKFDEGKPDLSLIPYVALKEEAFGFMLGIRKYGRYEYTKGLESSRLVAAALRHITLWSEGEELDPESGASHLGHARCCLAMLLHCQQLNTLKDNRYGKQLADIKVDDRPNLLDYIK